MKNTTLDIDGAALNTNLVSLVEEVEQGAAITITRQGKPVAILCAPEYQRRTHNRMVIEQLEALVKQSPLRITNEELDAWKSEGRA